MSTENATETPKTTETAAKKMYTLRSNDEERFVVEEDVAMFSITINGILEGGCKDEFIPIPNVSASILAKVIEYSKKHVESAKETEADLKAFDAEFVKEIDDSTLFELILAANYLNIKSLLDLTCQTVADKIKDMSVEQVRKLFNIENDFTEQEEADVRNENAWAFE